jgi:four helix bundle protein
MIEESKEFILEEAAKVYNIKHRAFAFSKEVINFIQITKFERIYFSIFDQLLRSATSVGANLVEGRSGSSTNDFIKFYTISLKSANETKYWLCLIRDTMEIDKNKVQDLIQEADELSKIIASIIVSIKMK